MRLYFDCCCYNRPFDDQTQTRIHDESEAILSLLHRSEDSIFTILDSTILKLEISKIRFPDKRMKVSTLHKLATEYIPYTPEIRKRAEQICAESAIHEMDALHLASAEAGHADIFLSTDDKLLHACRNIKLSMQVMNPVSFLAKVIEHAY